MSAGGVRAIGGAKGKAVMPMRMRARVLASVSGMALFATLGFAFAAGDIQAGKAKAAACAGCHGMNGEGSGANPPLAGRSEGEIVAALNAYRSGTRGSAVMQSVASLLSEKDMANLGAYYASLAK